MTPTSGLTTGTMVALLTATMLSAAHAGAIDMRRFNKDDIKPLHKRDWVHNEPMLGVHAPNYPPRQPRPDLQAHRDGDPTKRIELYPGMSAHVKLDKSFTAAFVGNTVLIDALPNTDKALIVQAKADKEGTTNIILTNENGEVVDSIKVRVGKYGQWNDEAPTIVRIAGGSYIDYDCTNWCTPVGGSHNHDDSKATSTQVQTSRDADGNVKGTETFKTYRREGPQQ